MLFARSDSIGGASIFIRDLCVRLPRHGVRASVLVGGTGPYSENLERHGVQYESIASLRREINPIRDLLAFLELRRALKRIRPDILACHSSKAGVIGRLAAATLRIPATYTAHCWAFDEGVPKASARRYLWIERAAAMLPGTIINCCVHDRDTALAHRVGAASKHRVVRNGIPDSSEFAGEPGSSPPRIVMVARFVPQKDHRTLIEALGGIKDLEWTAELIGDGKGMEACKSRVEELGLSERVAFPGFHPNAPERLAGAQIYALTTNWEGLPLTVLEAMRAGLPVVASDVGGISEAVQDGLTGYLVPRGNIEATRACLEELIADPQLRSQLGAEARRRFEAEFTHDRLVDEIVRTYSGLTGRSVETSSID